MMAEPVPGRPPVPTMSRSFIRLEHAHSSPLARSHTSTLYESASSPELTASPLDDACGSRDDNFDTASMIDGEEALAQHSSKPSSQNDLPRGFDDLPIELVSLIDRFIDSLGAKVHNTPPSIEKLTDIFQDFYLKAESSVATHISALSTQQSRSTSPKPSLASAKGSARFRSSSSKDTVGSVDDKGSGQQMLTPQEIDDRRKARRLLDQRGIAMEETVEKKVCERVYKRIWRHKSTLDEVRDEKFRSRTAALALVGIGMRDLGIDLDKNLTNNDDVSAAVEIEIEDYISKARAHLCCMNDARFPLGKLHHLAAAHKSIVDLLTVLHHSSSSADEILPTLIYTLIGTPPEGINIISNLYFIQRFRAASKLDGEAAYCLTNLEAAVRFVETVDLATLRSDELLEGPPKSRPTTPLNGTDSEPNHAPTSAPVAPSVAPEPPNVAFTSHPISQSPTSRPITPTSPSHHRRLSNIFQPSKDVLGAAGDAVRNTADQGLRNIGTTLDNSFKLLFGRLSEQKITNGEDGEENVVVPRTLDDAAKLVGPKPMFDDVKDGALQNSDTIAKQPGMRSSDTNDSIFGGNATGNRSTTSLQSSGNAKKPGVGLSNENISSSSSLSVPQVESIPDVNSLPVGNTAVESMRNLGNTLNPLKGFGGMSVMRSFGRSSPSTSPAPTVVSVDNDQPSRELQTQTRPIASHQLGARIPSPMLRFMHTRKAEDLRIADVSELLEDYKRLASALNSLGAFEAQTPH